MCCMPVLDWRRPSAKGGLWQQDATPLRVAFRRYRRLKSAVVIGSRRKRKLLWSGDESDTNRARFTFLAGFP